MFETKFTVNEDNKTLVVDREFAAPRSRVWQAWTDSKLLEQWWAPKPWKAVTRSFDFRVGGKWHYFMQGPEGEKHWALMEYETIDPQNSFSGQDSFCDEHANKNPGLPGAHWLNEFSDAGKTTKVRVTLTFVDVASMKKMIEMGFKEGFAMGLSNLDHVLAE